MIWVFALIVRTFCLKQVMTRPHRNICSHPEVDLGLQEQAPRTHFGQKVSICTYNLTTLWGLRFEKKKAFIVL